MQGASFGKLVRISLWGESHGRAIGAILEGIPAGIEIKYPVLHTYFERFFSPSPTASPRGKITNKSDWSRAMTADTYDILSGVFDNKTLGLPISIVFQNRDSKSKDYLPFKYTPRPGHADISYRLKFGHVDWRGGSMASGRIFIPVLLAGGFCLHLLNPLDIRIRSEVIQIGEKTGSVKELEKFAIDYFNQYGESLGGKFKITIENAPSGLGSPVFDKLHARLSHALFSIPGVKAVEFGAGTTITSKSTLEVTGRLEIVDGKIANPGNQLGGTLGGISYGENIVITVTVKPTPSLTKVMKSFDIRSSEPVEFSIMGRFDYNIAPKVSILAESLVSLVITDEMQLCQHLPTDTIIPFQERICTSKED